MFSQGEVTALAGFPCIETVSFGADGWIKKGSADAETGAQALKALQTASDAVKSGRYDLIIMDEVNGAVDFGLITAEDVLKVLSARPESVDLILTGRHADPRIIQAADVVTEMVNVKTCLRTRHKGAPGHRLLSFYYIVI